MRSRRFDIRARLAALSALRSSRLSLGRASELRRAVGRPLGSVLRGPRGAPSVGLAMSGAASAAEPPSRSSSWVFLRPSSFTVARLLRGRSVSKWPRPASSLVVLHHVDTPTLTCDERLPVMDDGPMASDDAAGLAPGRLQLPSMLVLVAPDSYGDSLSAVEAAAAIATGWTRSRPGDRFIVAPQSDGGPGFIEVLPSRLGQKRRLRVSGPLTSMVDAEWVFDRGSATAYLECAQACGLALLGGPPTP